MKQKSILIIKEIIKIIKSNKRPLTCQEILKEISPKFNLSYQNMRLYLIKIKNQLIISKKYNVIYYFYDGRSSIVVKTNQLKDKTKLILSSVIDILKENKNGLTCKQITIIAREKFKIRIAYRDMHTYLLKIREYLAVEKVGHNLVYRIDTRKKIKLIKDLKLK